MTLICVQFRTLNGSNSVVALSTIGFCLSYLKKKVFGVGEGPLAAFD